MSMRIFGFLFLFCTFASLPAQTTAPQPASKSKILETAVFTAGDLKNNEASWYDSFTRYSKQVERDIEVIHENTALFGRFCRQIQEKAAAYENQVKYYYNNMMQYDRYDALKITLYSEKISQKTREFKHLQNRFTDFISRIAEIQERYDNLATGQALIKEKFLPDDLAKLVRENHANTVKLHQKLAEWQKQIQKEQDVLTKIGETIQKIDEMSSLRQNEVISTIFFDNQSAFLNTLPEAKFILKYWLGEMSDAWNLHWNQVKQLNRKFLLDSFVIFVFLLLGGILFYYKILRKKIEDKLPAVFARRRQFFISFLILFAASSLYWTAHKELNTDTNLIRQLALSFFFVAALRIALALRMSRQEQKEVLPLYRVSMVVYFISILCSLFMISYSPLILFSTLLGAAGSLTTLWILRKQRTWHAADRVFGFCMLADFLVATLLGFYGFAYMSLTVMMSWFVIVSLMETIFGIGHFLRALSNAEEKPNLVYQLLRRFIIPLCWVGLLFYLVRWLAQTFHLEEKIFYFLNYQIIGKSGENVYINFTPWELMIIILVGIMLYLGINCLKILLENLASDSMGFGLLPSTMILGTYILWAAYIVFTLAMFKVQYSSILVILGGMSFGLGFGLKEIIENFLAGLILLVGQQIRPGDIVEVASDNTLGKVKKLTVRSTVVETYDGAIVAYPNAQVLTKDFRNWTSNNQYRRRELAIGVAYGSNLDQVCRILMEITRSTGGVMTHPAPEILCKAFGESSVDFEIRFWGHVNTSYQTASDLRRNIYNAFRDAGINIPYPQMDVHMVDEKN